LYTLVYEAHFGRKANDMKLFCLPKGDGAEPFALSLELYIDKCQEKVKHLLQIHRESNIFDNETCEVVQMSEWLENKIFGVSLFGGCDE